MTINSETRVSGPFAGNDVAVEFPFTFKVFQTADVQVVREAAGVEETLTLGSDYWISLNADQNAAPGGTVTLLAALATGSTLTITSAVEYLQPLDLTNQGGFYPDVVDTALDRLTILIQQTAARLGRAMVFPISDGSVADLPTRASRAGKALAFDSTGNPVAVDPSMGSVGVVYADLANLSSSKGQALLARGAQIEDSVANLRNLSKWSPSRYCATTGYFAAGDGGGALYRLDYADSTSVDNGGTVIVGADGGRWKLVHDGTLSARQFGAKGDGVADDTAAINAALATGRNVHLPRGTYRITGTLTIAAAQFLFGDGPSASIIDVVGSGYHAINITSSFSGVKDLQVTSATARTAGSHISIESGTRNNSVRDFRLVHAFKGIKIAGDSVITVIDNGEIVETCPATGYAISIEGGNDTFISKVVIDNAVDCLIGVGIYKSGAVWMSDVDIIHSGNALDIAPNGAVPGQSVSWCFFNQVACDTSSGYGIRIVPSNGASVIGLVFSNCWSSSNLGGIRVDGTISGAYVDGIQFNGCTLLGNKRQGVFVSGASKVDFNNCRITSSSLESPGTYAGMEFANNTIEFFIRGCRIGPMMGRGVSHGADLLIGTGCDYYVITDSNFASRASGNFVDKSATTSFSRDVRLGMPACRTQAKGNATIAASTTSIVVPHGLVGTPSSVTVTPKANIGTAGHWVDTFTSTSFTIRLTSAAPAGGVGFSWSADVYG